MFENYGTEEQEEEHFEELVELLWGAGSPVPISALKARREERGLSQHQLAARSQVSQAKISRVEAGMARLPVEVAGRLDAVLKTGASGEDLPLYVMEILSGLKRQALDGELSPDKMLRAASMMAETEATAKDMQPVIDKAVGAILDVAVTAAETCRGEASLKTRDSMGRRLDKPYGSERTEEDTGPSRTPSGRRVKKRFDPRRTQGR